MALKSKLSIFHTVSAYPLEFLASWRVYVYLCMLYKINLGCVASASGQLLLQPITFKDSFELSSEYERLHIKLYFRHLQTYEILTPL